MQGTATTMRSAALRADAPTISPAAAAPTVVSKTARAKTVPSGLLITGGVALLFCLGIGGFAIARRGFLPQLVGQSTIAALASPTVFSSVQSFSTDATATPVSVPTQTPVPAVATAFQAVNQNPGNPQTQLALSLAYWDAGQAHDSFLSLAQGADLAGRGNTQFFQDAADQFRQRQAWIAAAAMDVRAIKSLGPGALASDNLKNNFHEALYKASNQPDIPTYLSFDDLAVVEQPITLVAQARHLYYNGEMARAHEILNQVRTLKPHMAEASLLEAEMDANEGKTFDAKQTLNILLADLSTPGWMREMAQTLSNKIP
jgi:hypothetical protein